MAGGTVTPQNPLISVSQFAQQSPVTAQRLKRDTDSSTTPKLFSVSDIAKNGVPDNTPPSTEIPDTPEEQSRTRQMLVGGLTGMPQPVMNDQERSEFQQGKVAGAVSVPVVAAGTIGGTMAGATLPSVMVHTIDGVKAVGSWAAKNPVQAYLLLQVLEEAVAELKKAMGIVSHAPEGQ